MSRQFGFVRCTIALVAFVAAFALFLYTSSLDAQQTSEGIALSPLSYPLSPQDAQALLPPQMPGPEVVGEASPPPPGSLNPVPPRISVPMAQYFKRNPAAWRAFLSQLAPRPTNTPQATPQLTSPAFGGTWQAVTSTPAGIRLCNPLLLTDGTVIVQNCLSPDWYKLTPDITGSYVNGTWSQIASLPVINDVQYGRPVQYGPQYYASAVLPDGRVIIMGGEYNFNCGGAYGSSSNLTWTSLGAIYDPLGNTWTAVSPPSGAGWINKDPPCQHMAVDGGIGDAPSIVLPNGEFLLGAASASPAVDALLDATSLSWTSTGAPTDPCVNVPCGGGTWQPEQGYTLLPTGKVLTIDVWDPPNAQNYTVATGVWTSVHSAPVSLPDRPPPCGMGEIGPAVTSPDGTVVAFGGNTGVTFQSGCATPSPTDPTAIYNSFANTWTMGPSVPAVCGSGGTSCDLADAPAAMLPNGNILFAASAGYGGNPTHFFEFTSTNTIAQLTTDALNASVLGAYAYNFLVLPNGQILVTDSCRNTEGCSSNVAELYTPTGSPDSSWAPVISSVPSALVAGATYQLSGSQLNGLSQGAAYGDDVQTATNYPIVRIVNSATGHVFYARTFDHSTMSIAPSAAGSTSFTVPPNIEAGPSELVVVANGIASQPVSVNVGLVAYAKQLDFNGDHKSDMLWRCTNTGATCTDGTVAIWEMNGGTILAGVGGQKVTNGWQIVGTGDFNGDGKTDILWRCTDGTMANCTNGEVSIWEMSGGTVLAYVGHQVVPPGWTVVGTGDFNGDGKTDILWRCTDASGATCTNGTVVIWEMSGGTILASVGWQHVSPGWTIVGTGDFNGDGKTDILWRCTDASDVTCTNGTVVIWEMNGGTILAEVGDYVVATQWTLVQ